MLKFQAEIEWEVEWNISAKPKEFSSEVIKNKVNTAELNSCPWSW